MTGVLLMAYGTPSDAHDIEAFYTDIRGGRPPSAELLASLRRRYEAVGGRTPLLAITRRQAEALQEALGPPFQVFVGMRHWRPYIRDAVAAMEAAGIGHAVAVALTPHYSSLSVHAYMQAARAAASSLQLVEVASWHLQPAFLDAVAARVRAASAGFDPEMVVFTAHSLPERILQQGDPYVDQLNATGRAVAERLVLDRWQFSFQSAGATSEAWLRPDILETIDELANQGVRRLLVAPIGFIADHLEILYDLDVQARRHAASRGVELRRTESLNADPGLIEALRAAVLSALTAA